LVLRGGELDERKPLLIGRVLVDDPDLDGIVGLEGGFELIFGCLRWDATNESGVALPLVPRTGCADHEGSPVQLDLLGLGDRGIETFGGLELNKSKTAALAIPVDPPADDTG
jgi:hypothetical protein